MAGMIVGRVPTPTTQALRMRDSSMFYFNISINSLAFGSAQGGDVKLLVQNRANVNLRLKWCHSEKAPLLRRLCSALAGRIRKNGPPRGLQVQPGEKSRSVEAKPSAT